MCGVVGLFDPRGRREVERSWLVRMADRLAHRGPDGDGFYQAPGIGLGHRRLSVIDLAGGAQPMFNENATVAVVANCEIYNFVALRRELEALGHRFESRCDTEVIVHGWEEWGAECVTRFVGQFAIALWDARRETLFLARDRVGEKPLYYGTLDEGLVGFASELKALLADPRCRRDIDEHAVDDYFAYGYVPEPKTIYRGLMKLPAGHVLVWRRGTAEPAPQPYWRLRFTGDGPREMEEAATELKALLASIVEGQLVADVPLGAFLSGGIDSSSVVALMAERSRKRVETFTIGFADPELDESAHALAVAQRYNTNHTRRQVDPAAFDLLDRVAECYDEPFADASALPTLQVARIAREQVTVALSGDGGDEVFGGYRRYGFHMQEELLRSWLPQMLRGPLFGALASVYPRLPHAPRWLRARSTFEELSLDSATGYFKNSAMIPDAPRRRLYSEALRRRLDSYAPAALTAAHIAACDSEDPLAQAQYADMKMWLPGQMLTKVDRASMAASLEVRVPMLDHRLVEWAARLPSFLKRRRGAGKLVLKNAMQEHLPAALLTRPKQGFVLPIAGWLRGPLARRVEEIVSSPVLEETGLFDGTHLRRLAGEHRTGRADHSRTLWAVLMFESFLRVTHHASLPAIEEDQLPTAALAGSR
jgi:asparagine synthase (glutamine-hydrolysing)